MHTFLPQLRPSHFSRDGVELRPPLPPSSCCLHACRGCAQMALCIFGALGLATSAMSAKTFLVTGATDGIGLETVKQLTRKGHGVIVHGRTGSKVDGVVKDLQRGGGVARGYTADLASFAQIRAMADAVRRDFPVLDGLLNNAGTFDGDYSGKRVLTEDGNELSLQVNVLAPFLLTSLLLPCVRASGAGRVIIASSISMGAADALDDLQLEKGWSAHRAYSLSKLCDAMLSYELHSRYGDPPRLTFNTMDPTEECGMGCDTKMLRAGWGGWGAPASRSTISATMLTADEWAARSGEGFSGRREVRDAAARTRLWDACVQLTDAEYP